MKIQIKIIDVKEVEHNGLEITFQLRIIEDKEFVFFGIEQTQIIMRGDVLNFDLDALNFNLN